MKQYPINKFQRHNKYKKVGINRRDEEMGMKIKHEEKKMRLKYKRGLIY